MKMMKHHDQRIAMKLIWKTKNKYKSFPTLHPKYYEMLKSHEFLKSKVLNVVYTFVKDYVKEELNKCTSIFQAL